MSKFRVRFNLARGEQTYQKWQIKDEMGIPKYFDPEKVTLVFSDCKLINKKRVADKIAGGANKTVCGWVECGSYTVEYRPAIVGTKDSHVMYNPRLTPYWVLDGEDVDDAEFELMYTSGREIYIPYNGDSKEI